MLRTKTVRFSAVLLMVLGCCVVLGTDELLAARIEDNFDGPGLDAKVWRRSEDQGEVSLVDGAVRLYSPGGRQGILSLAPPLPNAEYALQFDLKPEREHWSGYAMTVQHEQGGGKPHYWYIEFMGGDRIGAMSVYRTLNGKWQGMGGGDLAAKGKLDPFKTWYRVRVQNQEDRVSVTIIARDTGEVIYDQRFEHDAGAPGALSFWPQANAPIGMAAAIDNLILVGTDVPALQGQLSLPEPSGQGFAAELAGGQFTISAQDDGRVFLARPDENVPFGCVFPRAQLLPDSKLIDLRCLDTTETEGGLAQHWRSESAGADLNIYYSSTSHQPWIQAQMEVKNRDDVEKQVRVSLCYLPTRAFGLATHRISFSRYSKGRCVKPMQEEMGAEPRWAFRGTHAMSFGKEEFAKGSAKLIPPIGQSPMATRLHPYFELYLPLLSVYNQRGGLVLSSNPRSSFIFHFAREGLSAQRIFFLKADTGFVDRGFFNGDVDVRYELYLGFDEKPQWARLWKDFYVAQNPWLAEGPKDPVLGTITGGLPDPDNPDEIRRFVELGTRYGTGVSVFQREKEVAEFASSWKMKLQQTNNIKVLIWSNIYMAIDPDKNPWRKDLAFDYHKFEDSWLVDKDGKILPCWDGVKCHPSPRFSYGKFQFKRLTEWIKKYGFDGIFLDYYGAAPIADWNRTYEHFPFYPLNVAMIEWGKALADWCHANDKLFIANCPHPSLMVHHLADVLSGDTQGPFGHASMIERMPAISAGKPHLLLGSFRPHKDRSAAGWLRGSLRALFYGELPCRWHDISGMEKEERDKVDGLFIHNLEIAKLLAVSEPRGGDFESLWFEHPDQHGFITLNNETERERRFEVKLSPYINLPETGDYQAVLWDLVDAPRVMAKGKGRDLSGQTFTAILKPGEVKIIAFVADEIGDKLLDEKR